MSNRYYVVQTQPLRERLAIRELQNQDFETFFPVLLRRPAVLRGKFQDLPPVPLFPKYVFVRLDLEDPSVRWRSINGTRGVVRLMSMNEVPSPVMPAAMERLLSAGEVIHEESAGLPFDLGDGVEFTSGPMAGLRGVVSMCEMERVTLLLSLLGGQREVRCSPDILKYLAAD